MQVLSLKEVVEQALECFADLTPQNAAKAHDLLFTALDQKPDLPALWYYSGALLAKTGRHALSNACLERCYALKPDPEVFVAIGANFRAMNQIEACRAALGRALHADPKDVNALINMAGSFVNEGDPLPGIEYGERAAAIEPTDSGLWNLALLYLEAGNYERGFELYAKGSHQHRENRLYALPGETELPKLTPALHENLKGQGKKIVVYGEQGIGDELMGGTMLCEVLDDYEVIFDCHPRLEWLHRHSYFAQYSQVLRRDMRIHPTRKNRGEAGQRDIGAKDCAAKVAMLDLCRLYRNKAEKFTWNGPTYRAPEAETAVLRAQLLKFAAGRKIVGIATRGGTVSTSTKYRRLPGEAIELLFDRDDTLFIGFDYEDMSSLQTWADTRFGAGRYFWPAAINYAWGYEHVAALIAATDLVISVPQSVMHLSAGMGHPTAILTPSKTDWRMGQTGSRWNWYPGDHCTLLRQRGDDWRPIIQEAGDMISALNSARKAA